MANRNKRVLTEEDNQRALEDERWTEELASIEELAGAFLPDGRVDDEVENYRLEIGTYLIDCMTRQEIEAMWQRQETLYRRNVLHEDDGGMV